MESTILMFAILRSGIHVAVKQITIEINVAPIMGKIGTGISSMVSVLAALMKIEHEYPAIEPAIAAIIP
ncbi:hypothetical protein D3C74_421700 [compost metagenome]